MPAADSAWHHLSGPDCLARLDSSDAGLTRQQAAERLLRYGANQLPQAPRRGPLRRLLLQFHNVLLYLMLAAALIAALIAALLGHWLDSGVIAAAVLVNVVVGFIQEGRADAALESIRGMLSSRARVLREGLPEDIDARSLVPGDIVLLGSGDRVPADLRLLEARNLKIDEAALTGESLPVDKDCAAVAAEALLGDRYGMAYCGTLVVYGQGRGLVVGTASQTELGRINSLLAQVPQLSTPLLRQMARFGRWLALLILLLVIATYALGTLWRGNDPGEMFMLAVALTAAAIPEGLPALMTVLLALGVQRMAGRHAIVRRLPAVETLGSVTVICSDKTGTLTRNEMTVQQLICADRAFQVEGIGYAPQGRISCAGQPADAATQALLQDACRAGLLCNHARLQPQGEAWQVQGDPTEAALLVLAAKAGLSLAAEQQRLPRLDSLPFESEQRFSASLHATPEGGRCIFVIGAPERLLEMCSQQRGSSGPQALDADFWRRRCADLAAQGLRLLAIASREAAASQQQLSHADMQAGFCLLGLVGIIDPPRSEAVAAVAQCHAAGIRVKMITGDHAETARIIAAQLGIGVGKPVLTGAELSLMSDASLRRQAQEIDVFARTTPEHKLRLVQALQACGEVVAMTGDGVNDAPALKRADVGVAMGHKGTEAAREAAAMILTDDNFATIGNAVHDGRAIYDNIRKSILFMLPTHGGQVLIVIAAILLQLALPLTPVQVLWINMVTSSTLCLALIAEPAEAGLMQRPPRAPDSALLDSLLAWRLLLVAVLMAAGGLGLFHWELQRGTSLETARSMVVNAVVLGQMAYLFSSRRLYASVLNRSGLLGNPWVLLAVLLCAVLQLLYTYSPVLQPLFGSAALDAGEWLRALAAALLVLLGSELHKGLMRRRRRD